MHGKIKDPDLKYLKAKMKSDFGVSAGKVARFTSGWVVVSANTIYLIEHALGDLHSINPMYEIDFEEIEEL